MPTDFREKGMGEGETKRDRETSVGLCPERGPKPKPFCLQDDAPIN